MATWIERQKWHRAGGGPGPIEGDVIEPELALAGWSLGEPPPWEEKVPRFFLVLQATHGGILWMRHFKCFPRSFTETQRNPDETMIYMDEYGGDVAYQLASRGQGVVVAWAPASGEAFAAAQPFTEKLFR